MNKLPVLATFYCVFICLGSLLAEERPPNIVFLLSDDQRADTIAALGNAHIETPNLDALVRRGTVFTRAHSTNPICVAIRAEILTGCRGFTNGVLMDNRLDESLPLWPAVMRDAGYDTWYVGKWHTSGRPSTRGYSDSLGGQQEKVRDRAYCYFRDVQRMVRDGRWKLIYYPKLDRYQLFDNKTDPHEINDLAADPRCAKQFAEIEITLQQWQRRVGDPLAKY